MDIVGIGTQVIECARVRKLIEAHGELFLRRVYTDREVQACNARPDTTEGFTSVWAAKEAVFRSLGVAGRKGVAWTDVEVLTDGPVPRADVRGATADRMAARGATAVLLTTAHCRAFATATAVAVRS